MRLLEFLHKIDEEALFEAAKDRYLQMFQNIPQEVYDYSKIDDSKIGDIVDNTMRAMQRSDRITWALRFTRYHILELAKNNAMKVIPAGFERGGSMSRSINTNEKNAEETKQIETAFKVAEYTNKEQQRLVKKSGLGPNILEMGSRTVATGTFLTRMEHFLSLPIPKIQDYQFAWQPPMVVEDDFETLENEWKEARSRQVSHTDDYEGDEIKPIIKFKDGSAWFDLQRSSCSIEGSVMGHCGNTADTRDSHTVLSYRTPVKGGAPETWKPHMTFILDKSNGTLGEMKGFGNEKPDEKYHPYIIELLKHPAVKGFGPGGYQPENNFSIDDLPEEQAEELKELKPGFMSPLDHYKKTGMTEELADRVIDIVKGITGEHTEWKPEDNEFVIDTYKNLTQAVEFVGGDVAKWVAGVMDGSNDNYQEHESYVEDSQIAEIMDSLDPELQQKISAYAEAKYGEEYEEDEIEWTDNGDLIDVFNEWEPDFVDGGKRAVARGLESGAEQEMYEDFNNWLKDLSEDYSISIKHNWDEGAELRISEEGMAEIASDDEVLYEIESEGLTSTLVPKDMEQPYNGWSGYDEAVSKEAFIEELDEDIYNYKPETEKVEA